jgi:hypothetical protein
MKSIVAFVQSRRDAPNIGVISQDHDEYMSTSDTSVMKTKEVVLNTELSLYLQDPKTSQSQMQKARRGGNCGCNRHAKKQSLSSYTQESIDLF